MKRKAFLLIAALAMFGLGACLSSRKLDAGNSKNSFDWEGVYTGIIPSAGGQGIDVRLKLNRDQSFELKYEYIDIADGLFDWTGSFKWDDTGSVIILDIVDMPPYYKAAGNTLIQLDMDGKLISGNFADNYVLKKER